MTLINASLSYLLKPQWYLSLLFIKEIEELPLIIITNAISYFQTQIQKSILHFSVHSLN